MDQQIGNEIEKSCRNTRKYCEEANSIGEWYSSSFIPFTSGVLFGNDTISLSVTKIFGVLAKCGLKLLIRSSYYYLLTSFKWLWKVSFHFSASKINLQLLSSHSIFFLDGIGTNLLSTEQTQWPKCVVEKFPPSGTHKASRNEVYRMSTG